jgi:hypothetical protein
MATKMRIFSGLALTAATLFVVPLSSEEASAGGGHGGGMRSFSVVRTSPVIMSRVRTTSVSAVHKQTVSKTKLKNFQAGDKLKNKQVVDKLKNSKLKNAKLSPHTDPCMTSNVAGAASPCPTPGGNAGGNNSNPGGNTGGKDGPVQVYQPTGPIPVSGSIPNPVKDPVKDPVTSPVTSPPPATSGNHRPFYPPVLGVGIGAAPAPVVVDPPGCVYERSVRKLPGGGLQRVIVKICPDA